jgi:hypothetical protein
MQIRNFILWGVLILSACSTPGEQYSSKLGSWKLPGPPREVVQLLSGRYNDQTFQFQIRLSLTEDKMQMVGVDSLGRRAFGIVWNETGIVSKKADWMTDDLQAEDILKVIIATYWPEDDPLQEVVSDRTASLQIVYQSDRKNAWTETVEIQDPNSGYEMTITSYELAE